MHQKAVLLALIGLFIAPISAFAQSSHDAIPYEELPRMGDQNAPVKVVEFADFKCPHCKTFTTTVFPKLKQEFIDSGIVAFYYLSFPVISQDSVTAGAAASAVYDMYGADAFWDFQKALYRNQGNPGTRWATPEYLSSLAASVVSEADPEEVRRVLESDEYVSAVRRDLEVGQALGVRGTPTIVVGDTLVQNYRNYDEIRSLILSKR